MDYTISSSMDKLVLYQTVEELNEKIQQYKRNTNKDELRATVLAALDFVAETVNIKKQNEKIANELKMCEGLILALSQKVEDQLNTIQ